ncbi:polysaccharide deacetylase family protein [Aequorivita echinoideorum]|uniref:Polysaccharide deacetylase family protein n=1 Tax=Aequorivita echinoideorum TaxID=1549647 RepID=A0ABS5S3F8_9FLAO|nr:polysaccharide deacetylase family protein [Aequorivita echinoideorum]MBT0607744.1 polysaccharide deacetylase family protein [Aequorivita echinoideorum]
MLKFYTVNALAIALFSMLIFAGIFGNVSLWLYFLFIIIWAIITAIGSFQIGLNYHFQSFSHNHRITENEIAITFDDGPHPIFTPKILALLKKFNARATFFLIGKNAENHPELVNQIIAEGHAIGNHSYSHSRNFGFFSSNKISSEIEKTNSILKEISGIETKFFRPPFGVTNPNLKKALADTQMHSIGWSKRSFDTTKLSEIKILRRITTDLKKGDIILLHDTGPKTVAVLEQLLLFLQTQELKPVTVDKILKIDTYA